MTDAEGGRVPRARHRLRCVARGRRHPFGGFPDAAAPSLLPSTAARMCSCRRTHDDRQAGTDLIDETSGRDGVLRRVVLTGLWGIAEAMADGSVDDLDGDDFFDLPKYWCCD